VRDFFHWPGPSGSALTDANVGTKGSGLGRLDRLGFPVPPALAISVDACREHFRDGVLDAAFRTHLESALHDLETATALALGPGGSLIVAVRSSPVVSMPGVLETIANVGLSEANIPALIRRTGDPWLAWDAYRRLVRAFAHVVHHVPRAPFDMLEARQLGETRSIEELDPLALRDLARNDEVRLVKMIGAGIPEDPVTQIVLAIEAVLRSWHSAAAQAFRRFHGLDDDLKMGVLVQAMVFGTCAGTSGSGVAFTRDPVTGEDALYADFVFHGQGDDLASGRTRVDTAMALPTLLPDVWNALEAAKQRLEREFRDMQAVEFVVEDGRLYFVQVRAGHRTSRAALQVAVDLVGANILDTTTALERVSAIDVSTLARTRVVEAGLEPIATGVPASPGIATGEIVFDADRARRRAGETNVILLRRNLAIGDLAGIAAAAGVASVLGGRTSHVAVMAQQLGKVCVVGCGDVRIDEHSHSCVIGPHTFHEGDTITVDGDGGRIYAGAVPVVTEPPSAAAAQVEAWRATLCTRAGVPSADHVRAVR
jgi:pyruvate,orthophosphate dikinase